MSATTPYATSSVISKDGTIISYRQLGSGPGLILVHGGMQAAQNFIKLAASLADAFTVYVPERRGRGRSGPHGKGYNLAKECEDIEALVTKTGAKNIFGLSSGAIIALQATLTLPALRRVAAYEPPFSIHGSSPTAWVPRFDREIAEGKIAEALVTVLKGLEASPAFVALPRFVLAPFLKLAITQENHGVEEGKVSLKSLIPTMHFDVQLVKETEDGLERFRSVEAEVLLLGGSKSQRFLHLALDALETVLKDSRRVELKGLDHLGPSDDGKPERVSAELRRFFTSA